MAGFFKVYLENSNMPCAFPMSNQGNTSLISWQYEIVLHLTKSRIQSPGKDGGALKTAKRLK